MHHHPHLDRRITIFCTSWLFLIRVILFDFINALGRWKSVVTAGFSFFSYVFGYATYMFGCGWKTEQMKSSLFLRKKMRAFIIWFKFNSMPFRLALSLLWKELWTPCHYHHVTSIVELIFRIFLSSLFGLFSVPTRKGPWSPHHLHRTPSELLIQFVGQISRWAISNSVVNITYKVIT